MKDFWNQLPQAPDKKPESYLSTTECAFEDDNENIATVIASSGLTNRLSEVVEVKGGRYDNYLKNPVVLWSHDWDSLPIARTIALTIENDLRHRIEFSPMEEAQQIRTLYKLGFLNAWSIGFIVNDTERTKDVRKVIDWELLELSGVVIPADANALTATLSLFNNIRDKTEAKEGVEEAWRDTANRMRHLTSEIYRARTISDSELAMLNEVAKHAITLMASGTEDYALAANFFLDALQYEDNERIWLDFVREFGERHNILHTEDERFKSLMATLESVRQRSARRTS